MRFLMLLNIFGSSFFHVWPPPPPRFILLLLFLLRCRTAAIWTFTFSFIPIRLRGACDHKYELWSILSAFSGIQICLPFCVNRRTNQFLWTKKEIKDEDENENEKKKRNAAIGDGDGFLFFASIWLKKKLTFIFTKWQNGKMSNRCTRSKKKKK